MTSTTVSSLTTPPLNARDRLDDRRSHPGRRHVAEAADQLGEPIIAVEVTVDMTARLGDSVGEEDHAVARPQQLSRVVQLGFREQAKQSSWLPDCLNSPVRAANQGERVSCGTDPHGGNGEPRTHSGVDRGQEPRVIGGPVQQRLIQPGQDQARPGLPEGGASQRVACQRGALGRGDSLAAHVADDEPPAAAHRGKHVVEVPEDLGPASRPPGSAPPPAGQGSSAAGAAAGSAAGSGPGRHGQRLA